MLKTKRITLCAVLIAAALTIFIIEAQIPTLVPIPGIKLGLANIITLFALIHLSFREAFLILIARILLSGFVVGNPITLIYSLLGGLGCLAVECVLLKLCGKNQIWAISAAGAMVHNIIQLTIAAIITHTLSVFRYLPVLLISGIITGLFNGFCILYLEKSIDKYMHKLL